MFLRRLSRYGPPPVRACLPPPVTGAPLPGRARRGVFYGWRIALAGAGLQLINGSVLGQAFGSYAVALRDDMHWSATALSTASALREMETGVNGPWQGTVIDRFGSRRVARVGVVLLAIGLVLFSRVQNLPQFYGAFVVMAVGSSLMGYLTLTSLIVQWFDRRRSSALSLLSVGGAFAGMLLPFTVVRSIEAYGWRPTVLGSAVVLLLIGLPLCQTFVDSPAQRGLLPDGATREESETPERLARRATEVNFTLREAMHTSAFWWVACGHGSALFVVAAINVHLQLFLTGTQGYTLHQASLVTSLITAMFLVGNVGGGIIGDYANKRLLAIVAMLMHMTGMLLIANSSTLPVLLAGAVIHGLAWGGRGPQMAAIRAEYFGRAAFGKIMGVSNGVIIIGTIAGPLIAAYMYDTTGSYRLGFDMLALMSGAGSIFFVLARPPQPPMRGPAAPLPGLSDLPGAHEDPPEPVQV